MQVPGVAQVEWDALVEFLPDCVDVTVATVPVTQFYQQQETTFVSNIFVKTLRNFPSGYNIVKVRQVQRIAHNQR